MDAVEEEGDDQTEGKEPSREHEEPPVSDPGVAPHAKGAR